MTVSKRIVRATPARSKLRTARLVVYKRSHVELTMLGFELEHLDDLKDSFSMHWSKEDRCWLLSWRDLDDLVQHLENAGFIVRCRPGTNDAWR